MIWINPVYRSALARIADDPYDAVMQLDRGRHYGEKQGRSVGRYALRDGSQSRGIYVKRYARLRWWQRWLSPLRWFPGPAELANLRAAQRLGIPVPEPVAAGADRRRDCPSFFATRSLEGFTPLHEYIPVRLRDPLSADARGLKWEIIRRLAECARRMHEAAYFHRDLYLCHFFVRENPQARGGIELILIDYTRLTRSYRNRWQVKDLAQLLFSADCPEITSADCLRFFKHYLGRERLNQHDRRLIRKVLRKRDRYRRHNEKRAEASRSVAAGGWLEWFARLAPQAARLLGCG